jgi:hypothetical protein
LRRLDPAVRRLGALVATPGQRRSLPHRVAWLIGVFLLFSGCVRYGFESLAPAGSDASAADTFVTDTRSADAERDTSSATVAPRDGQMADNRNGLAIAPAGWTWTAGSPGCDLSKTVTVDAARRIYLAGYFEQTLDADCGQVVTSNGAKDAFILRMESGGACGWIEAFGGTGNDWVQALDIGTDYLVAAGDIQAEVQFDDGMQHVVPEGRSIDAFVARLDHDGAFQWVYAQPGTVGGTYEFILGDMILAEPAIYLTGRFGGRNLVFGDSQLTDVLSDNGWGDVFLSRLTVDGAYLWTRSYGGAGSDRGYTLAHDTEGNLYLAGNIRGSVDFDVGSGQAVRSGSHDGFLMRQAADDLFDWVDVTTVNRWAPRKAVTVDPEGLPVAAGVTYAGGEAAATIERFSKAGVPLWQHAIASGSSGAGTLVETDKSPRGTVDPAGMIYLAGVFTGTIDFNPTDDGEDLKRAVGGQDIFVAVFRPDGSYVETVTLGGLGNERIEEIVPLGPGELLITGSFEESVDFGTAQNRDVRVSSGCSDIFVTRRSF